MMETSGIEEWYAIFQDKVQSLLDDIQSITRATERTDAITGGLTNMTYDLKRVMKDIEQQRDWLADYRRWLTGEKRDV